MTEAQILAKEIEDTITQGPEPNIMAKWLCRLAKIVAQHEAKILLIADWSDEVAGKIDESNHPQYPNRQKP